MARKTVQLTPSWMLTTEHSAVRYGVPVLVRRQDQSVAYGPGDIVQFSPGAGGIQPAAYFVHRFAQQLTGVRRELARRFLSQWPEGPQLSE